MIDKTASPEGQMLLRTLAMPADANANGDIFGGWIMSQMDIAGSILAKEIALGRTCTVAVNGMTFLEPVQIGDVVCCYGSCSKVGNSSLTIQLEVWVKPVLRQSSPEERFCVTQATFTYVAIDDEGKPRRIPEQNRAIYSQKD
ncbi:acyl-CoA thioester hydrolase YciA [Celerinatantimonas yamalensis]|uniref:Acyl-CoA thioester hydrolase YciA n=1 Tax=Celerinatantimonas yamalensis TaxID=559956 RepID=A0ABW9G7Z8_9GAMM